MVKEQSSKQPSHLAGPGGSGGSIDGVIVVDPGEEGYIPGELEDIVDGTIPCSDDSNCPEGYKCVDGKCVLVCTEEEFL